MTLRFAQCCLLSALLPGGAIGGTAVADRWQSLRENDPFVAYVRPVPPPEPAPPRLELRGVLVEGSGTWFNVYNAETKESAWVQQGDRMADFVIKDYDAAKEALVLDYQQRPVSVALKQSKIQLSPGSVRNGAAMASLGGASRASPPLVAPVLPASESQRLESVAEQIRQRREGRRKAGEGSRT